MQQVLNESQFISMFSEDVYKDMIRISIDELLKSDRYKKGGKYIVQVLVFPVRNKTGKYHVVAEALSEVRKNGTVNFGFVRLELTDGDYTDMALDRYNENKKYTE